jgi:heme-degrading monooxygenase HmoA
VTVIRINAIEVSPGSGDELALRFARRAGAVDGAAGFEGFELLRPTDDRHTWLVITRWRDEESFRAWTASPAFAHGHRGASDPGPDDQPVARHSELWSYDVVDLTGSGA